MKIFFCYYLKNIFNYMSPFLQLMFFTLPFRKAPAL